MRSAQTPHSELRGLSGRSLFGRQCVSCDSDPVCNCASGERCILTSRTCSQCPTIQCIKNESSSKGSGINPGVIAGPVVAVLVLVSLALFWWLRKKKRRDMDRLEQLAKRARKAESAGFSLSPATSPQPPSAHSASLRSYHASQLPVPPPSASRRSQRSPLPPAAVNGEYYDDNGNPVRVYRGNGTINLDPRHPDNGGAGDPFADRQSISTNGSSSHSTNIIPIQYIPPSESEGGVTDAARTLDEARQNLFRPKDAPRRPARAPDLDLRLNPPAAAPGMRDLRSPGGSGRIRDSYTSDNSAAPSFLSGNSYDVHNDAPKIITSKQVHVGRLQQAEVVQFGSRTLSPTAAHDQYSPSREPSSPNTFGRHLTPSPRGYGDEEEGLTSEEPSSAESTDLRFSMGSLAYRDSVSTMGFHGRDSAAVPPPRIAASGSSPLIPPTGNRYAEPRESMVSNKSYADSVLSGFPMIPPSQHHPIQSGSLPQSSSIATLDHAAHGTPSRPPPSFRPPPNNARQAQSRPNTNFSTADSVLSDFTFVHPGANDLAGLPSAGLPSAAVPDTAKNKARSTAGMSTTSEGLGAFDFRFDSNPPPLPKA